MSIISTSTTCEWTSYAVSRIYTDVEMVCASFGASRLIRHRIDHDVAIEKTMKALVELKE